MQILVAEERDAAALAEIYSYYVEKTAITFEYETPSTEEFTERIHNIKEKYPYIVAEENGEILGYAYGSAFHPRAAYGWCAEMSIYVKHERRGSGLPEYQLNLDVSLLLKNILEQRGYQVVMTRTDNDTAISNKERAELVASQGAEICVRIHANGDDSSSVSGALTMCPSQQNPYVSSLYDSSNRLSQCIVDSYCAATGFQNRGIIYTDTMTGINWSTIPVTIVEMGFMTNQNDDLKMADSSFQQTMAEGIANGIDAYFQ